MSLSADSAGLLVKPDVARRQMDAETAALTPAGRRLGRRSGGAGATGPGLGPGARRRARRRAARSGSTARCTLDPARVGRDASRIADEVIAHLAGLVGAEVTVTLEIEAELPGGAPDQVVRTVTENSRTLKFTSQGFESE